MADSHDTRTLPEITRRKLLASAASAAPLLALPAVAFAAAQAQTPTERMAYHLAEFQKAAQEADPRIDGWTVDGLVDRRPDMRCALSISAFRWLSKFDGDGWYLIRTSDESDPRPHHASLDHREIDGQRSFFLN